MAVRDILDCVNKLYMYMPDDAEQRKPRIIRNHNLSKLTMLRGDCSAIYGRYTHNIYGDCSKICGDITGLKGDVSGLSGNVTDLRGVCTGLTCNCDDLQRGDIKTSYRRWKVAQELLKQPLFCGKTKFLTEEDNERLWEVWLKMANCTIGLTEDEYNRIERPIKNKPPFPVDKWGRHYIKDEDGIIVFSINPVDIFLLRTNQEKQSCWSLYDKTNGTLRMRLLLALNCINPTVGCCFRIKYIDKFNIFNGLSFKYYKHESGTFFQYNEKGIRGFGDVCLDLFNYYPDTGCFVEPKLYGHDGHNCGHGRQTDLMFYEKYIKDDFSLVPKCVDKPKDTEHVLANFSGYICLDKEFNVLAKYGIEDYRLADFIKSFKERYHKGVFDEKV